MQYLSVGKLLCPEDMQELADILNSGETLRLQVVTQGQTSFLILCEAETDKPKTVNIVLKE